MEVQSQGIKARRSVSADAVAAHSHGDCLTRHTPTASCEAEVRVGKVLNLTEGDSLNKRGEVMSLAREQ